MNEELVCAWSNTEGDPSSGGSFAHDPDEPAPMCMRGNGARNTHMLLMTPHGEIFWALAGYIGAEELRTELRNALDTFARLRKQRGERRRAFVTAVHEREIARLESQPKELLGDWTRQRRLRDHRFAAENPLAPARRFQTETLVSREGEWFGSSSSGGFAGEQIGKERDFGETMQRTRDQVEGARDRLPERARDALDRALGGRDGRDGRDGAPAR